MSDQLFDGLRTGRLSRREFMRLSLLFGAGVATSFNLMGCGPQATTPTDADRPTPSSPRGTMTIAQGADLTSTDPHQTQGSAPRAIVAACFDALVMFDHDFNVTPWLATSWTLVDDLTTEFELRDDVKFHNGQPFTSHDVKWSVERFVSPETQNIYANTLEPIKEIQILSDHKLRMITAEPYPFLLQNMALYFFIAPMETMQDMGDAYFDNPIGTGPYKFVSWTPGDRVVQEAAEPHFSGLPLIENVQWRTITESATKITGVKTGELDMIDGVPSERIGELESDANINVVEQYRQSHMLFVLNCTEKPFDDVRVRQALNYAIDKQSIIDNVLFGAGKVMQGALHRIQEGYNPDLEPYPYDPDKAKELLAAAGYPDGLSFTLDIPSGRYPKDREVAEAAVGQWREIGVRAEINPLEWGSFVREAQEKNWLAFLIAQGPFSSHLLVSTCFSSRTKGLPWLNYFNEEVDDLIDAAGSEMDEQERIKMFQRIVEIVHEECPWVFLFNFPSICAIRDRVQGWKAGNEIIMLLDTWVKT